MRSADATWRLRLRRAAHLVRRSGATGLAFSRFAGLVLIARIRRRPDVAAVVGVNLRQLLEHLGFTYIKLGQFLALRFDILPPEVCNELRALFDRAPTMPFGRVVDQIERELGAPVAQVFRSIEPRCLAAASLAQVHIATTLDGARVAVKVQRPEAQDNFEADMWLARWLARAIDATGSLRSLSVVSLVAEFEDFTRRELDFQIEATVAMRVRNRANLGIRIPKVRWDLTTTRLLTMEYIEGVSLGTAIELAKRGKTAELAALLPDVDLADVVRQLANESLRQVLVDGLFHADPHPGNVLVCRDGAVVYVDFGSFGRLTRQQRHDCSGYMEQNALGNFDRGFRHFFRLMNRTADLDYAPFKRDVTRIMRIWSERSNQPDVDLSERHLGTVMLRTLAAMRLHGVRPGAEFLLFWRVTFLIDSIAVDLQDEVDMFVIVREFFAQEMNFLHRRRDALGSWWPPDAGSIRGAVAQGVALARPGRPPRDPRPVIATSLHDARSGRIQRAALVTMALVFVVCSYLISGPWI
jgi:ubiquinone biosynthesis protein